MTFSLRGVLHALRGSLRLGSEQNPAGPVTKSAFDDETEKASSSDANYYQKLTTLFPAEALAIYGTGSAIFGEPTLAVVATGLVVLLVLRIVANQQRQGSQVDWRAVVVAVVSYLLWTTANNTAWLNGLAIDAATIDKPLRQYAAFFGAAVVVLAPVIAPGSHKAAS